MAENFKGWICHEAGQVIVGLILVYTAIALKATNFGDHANELMMIGVATILRAQGTGGTK